MTTWRERLKELWQQVYQDYVKNTMDTSRQNQIMHKDNPDKRVRSDVDAKSYNR